MLFSPDSGLPSEFIHASLHFSSIEKSFTFAFRHWRRMTCVFFRDTDTFFTYKRIISYFVISVISINILWLVENVKLDESRMKIKNMDKMGFHSSVDGLASSLDI